MSDTNDKCPICYSLLNKQLYNLEIGQLLKCKQCQTIFYSPRPTPQELINFYNSDQYRECYQISAMSGKNFAQVRYQQLSKILNRKYPHIFTTKDKQLLDIGCAEGDLLTIAAANGWQVMGTEISPQAAEKANKLLLNNVINSN